jgi:hypothetical protein
MQIDYDSFINFCRGKVGVSLDTIGRSEKTFKLLSVTIYEMGYRISTGRILTDKKESIQRVINRFEETGSYKTSDYTDITRMSSYTLALVRLFVEEIGSK